MGKMKMMSSVWYAMLATFRSLPNVSAQQLFPLDHSPVITSSTACIILSGFVIVTTWSPSNMTCFHGCRICSVLTWLGISESVPDWITESWLVTLERPSLCRYISTDYSCESSTLPNKTEMSWAHQIHWTASTPSGGVIHKGQDLTAQCNADVGCYLPHLWVWHNHNLTAIVKGMLAHSSTTGVLHLTVCLCFQIVTIYVQWHLLL